MFKSIYFILFYELVYIFKKVKSMDELWERVTQYVGSFVIISTVVGVLGFMFYRLTIRPVVNDFKKPRQESR